ncbi:MAG: RNA pseudouridine synthase, partial [Lacticaseibacillus paracasei]|nr:RNA pseudouridine synthase [Lacticaseibacillus paracasei]
KRITAELPVPALFNQLLTEAPQIEPTI